MRAHDGSIPLMKSRLQLGNSRSLPSSHSMQPHYRHRKSTGKSISTLGMHWRGLWCRRLFCWMYRGGAGYRVGGMRREKGKWGWHIKVLIRSPLTSKSKEIAWGRYVMKELTTRVPNCARCPGILALLEN